jgi:2-desacetyl-2-hydroxyethyl bacteriochlorophyllide A dehydrogenase
MLMKAMVWTKYGPPEALELQEVEKPTPQDHEVLIRIYATTASAGDCETRSLRVPLLLGLGMRLYAGLRRPTRIKIIGQELAGEIEAVGKEVRSFQAGDQVFAALGFGMGAYAEYKCMPEHPTEMEGVLARKPSNVTYEEAAAVPVGGLNAWHFLRQGNLQRGQKVLIHGAGGSIGTIAIQLAKHLGAEVTAVDSTGKLNMLRSIGADQVVDYTQEDFTKRGQTYDVIFDVVGKASFSGCIRSLKEGGIYLIAYPRLSQMVRGWWTAMASSKKVIGGNASYRPEDLEFLKELIEAGEIQPVIDRRYPLAELAEAHRYVESGHKKGNVVITV